MKCRGCGKEVKGRSYCPPCFEESMREMLREVDKVVRGEKPFPTEFDDAMDGNVEHPRSPHGRELLGYEG